MNAGGPCYLRALHHFLPEGRIQNSDLVGQNPSWNADKIFTKTGIRSRPVALEKQTAGDLGFLAARQLLDQESIAVSGIDALIFISQSPDYILPATASTLHDRLGLNTQCAALDINLGCSGFTYGLWLSCGLIGSGQCDSILLICADTYSRFCNPHDLSTASLFSDAGAAALITSSAEQAVARIGPTILGTDGKGAQHLIVPQGGARFRADHPESSEPPRLWMDGPEVFQFGLDRMGPALDRLLTLVRRERDDIDLYLFHQANRFMLTALRDHLELPPDRFPIDVEEIGNAATASLPVLVSRQLQSGAIPPNCRSVLAGFGVGFSWALTYVEWI